MTEQTEARQTKMGDKGNARVTSYRLVLAALFTALTTLATALPVIPVGHGYIHLGDGVIFASAILLGPWAAVVGGLGSALADLMAGYVVYAPATLIIKAGMGLIAAKLLAQGDKTGVLRRLTAFAAAELWMLAGYFAYECVIFAPPAAIAALLPNLIQAGGGVVVGFALAPIVQRLKRK